VTKGKATRTHVRPLEGAALFYTKKGGSASTRGPSRREELSCQQKERGKETPGGNQRGGRGVPQSANAGGHRTAARGLANANT